MPQKSLAYHIGVSHQNVQKYEAGDIIPSAYRLKQIAEFYKVKTDDLVDPTFIHRSTKSNESLYKAQSFYAKKYEEFEDEYTQGTGALEKDPKMQATYDAILEDK
jgi:transcriptional regulator with XRE-family HTH domain